MLEPIQEDDESDKHPSTQRQHIEDAKQADSTYDYMYANSDSLADDESSGSEEYNDEEVPMKFNKQEIESLDRLLKSAELYVGQEDSLDNSDSSNDQISIANLANERRHLLGGGDYRL